MRRKSSGQLRMCSNISTETIRSKAPRRVEAVHVAVTTSRLASPRRRASPRMNARWLAEFETAPTTREAGKCSAAQREKLPQPQPSSRMRWPSRDARPLAGEVAAWPPRRRRGSRTRLPEAARVLQVAAEDELGRTRQDLVVLPVRERAATGATSLCGHPLDEPGHAGFAVAVTARLVRPGDHGGAADAGADHGLGDQAALCEVDGDHALW